MLQSVVGLLMVAMLAAASVAMFPPQCAPEVLEEVDNPKVHEICRFLQTYADAVEQQQFKGLHVPIGLIDGGVKRQDVDHVFLRFGRRRR